MRQFRIIPHAAVGTELPLTLIRHAQRNRRQRAGTRR